MLDQYSIDRIADRMAIQDIVCRWCHAVDRLDYEGMRSVFHPDGTDNHGSHILGVNELVDWVRERHKTIPFSMHFVSNIMIEFVNTDLALTESYVRVVRRYPPGTKAGLARISGKQESDLGDAADLLTCSRYVDRFERRNGEWRIFRRKVVQEWMQIVDIPAQAFQRLESRMPSARNKDDFYFRERVAIGLDK